MRPAKRGRRRERSEELNRGVVEGGRGGGGAKSLKIKSELDNLRDGISKHLQTNLGAVGLMCGRGRCGRGLEPFDTYSVVLENQMRSTYRLSKQVKYCKGRALASRS